MKRNIINNDDNCPKFLGLAMVQIATPKTPTPNAINWAAKKKKNMTIRRKLIEVGREKIKGISKGPKE